MPNKNPKDVYIIFLTNVNSNSAEQLTDIIFSQIPQDVENVHLLISTSGGSVPAGIGLYNLLRGMPYNLITYNLGNIDSIGNLIFSAGDERYAVPGATFLIHKMKCEADKGMIDLSYLKEKLTCIEGDQERVNDYLIKRTKLTKKELEEFYKVGEAKDTGFALSKGMISKVKEVSIPKGAKVFTVKSGGDMAKCS